MKHWKGEPWREIYSPEEMEGDHRDLFVLASLIVLGLSVAVLDLFHLLNDPESRMLWTLAAVGVILMAIRRTWRMVTWLAQRQREMIEHMHKDTRDLIIEAARTTELRILAEIDGTAVRIDGIRSAQIEAEGGTGNDGSDGSALPRRPRRHADPGRQPQHGVPLDRQG